MSPEREARLRAVFQKRQMDLTLITERVHKPRNISALIRNCDAVGIAEMHFVEPESGYRSFNGTSMGSDRWVESVSHDSVVNAVQAVKSQGMKVYAAHLSDSAVDFRKVDYTQPCAIMMGAEKDGISDEAAALADEHIIIPMLGMVESFNVSTAAGIILIEAQRQRLNAGMYEREGLPAERAARYLFESRYPKLARYYQVCEADYPAFDLNGELLSREGLEPIIARGRDILLAMKRVSRQQRKEARREGLL